MKEKLVSNVQKKVNAASRREPQPETKKPFQEPILTKHETLVENTHVGATGAVGAVAAPAGGP